MTTVGPRYPVTITESAALAPYDDEAWDNEANIGADDTNYASITAPTFDTNDYSYRLVASNFGFTIPGVATINGITVNVARYYANGAVIDALVSLTKAAGTAVGDNKSAGATWATSMAEVAFGGADQLWGTTWDPADINGTGFGVVFAGRASGDNADAYVDYINVTVTYTVAYSLTCDYGSAALTGQVVSVEVGRKLSAAQGSIELTGQAVTFDLTRKLTCAQGSFALTGQNVTLTSDAAAAYELVCAQGSFALTGQAVSVERGYTLTCAQGSYALAGESSVSLADTILALNPIAYWKLDETSGTAAINYGSLGTDANGTYSGPTLAQMAAPGGGLAPLFDGVNDFVNIYSAALNGGINFNTVTVLLWIKIYNSAAWGVSAYKFTLNIGDSAAPVHYLQLLKNTTANQFYVGAITYGAVTDSVLKSSITETGWFLSGFTVDKAADQMKAYYNGAQEGVTQTGLGDVSSPVLTSTLCAIGAQGSGGSLPWYGYLSHAAIFTSVLTAEEIAAVYAAGTGAGVTEWTNIYVHRKLTASQGSITLTGQAVSVKAGRTLSGAQGSYALTGQTAALLAARKLSAAQGSYTLTGQTAGILYGRILAFEYAAYAVTGQSAGSYAGRLLALAYGLLALTGQSVTFDYAAADTPGSISGSDAGAYGIVGVDVSIYAISSVDASYSSGGVATGSDQEAD